MGLWRSWLVVVALLLPAGAWAGDHKADMCLAGSFIEASGSTINLGGLQAAVAFAPIHNHPKLGVVGDLGVHFIGGEEGTNSPQGDVTQVSLMFGPRYTPFTLHNGRIMPFVEAMLVGFVDRVGGSHPSDTVYSLAFGGGVDWAPGDKKTWGSRLQFDYIRGSGDISRSLRFSAGAIYRFPFKHQ